jgi:hypothetical protein
VTVGIPNLPSQPAPTRARLASLASTLPGRSGPETESGIEMRACASRAGDEGPDAAGRARAGEEEADAAGRARAGDEGADAAGRDRAGDEGADAAGRGANGRSERADSDERAGGQAGGLLCG